MPQETIQQSPALTASQSSWRCVQARDRAGWLALMAASPDSTTRTSRPINSRSPARRPFRPAHQNEIAHILVLDSKFDNGVTSSVRGVFTYRVDDAGLITNMRGYWTMDAMTFGQEE